MLINEIIDPEISKREIKSPMNLPRMIKAKDRREYSSDAAGAYAYGSEVTGDPHLYSKKSFMPSRLEQDAYYQYIKAAGPHMGENPYLPRVYKINVIADPLYRYKPSYKLEKLDDLASCDRAELRYLIESAFPGYLESLISTIDTSSEWAMGRGLIQEIKLVIEGPRQYPKYAAKHQFTVNPELLQAATIIQRVISSNKHFSLDLHSKNVMVRRTQVGVQLVITDPIQDGGHSVIGAKPWSKGSSAPVVSTSQMQFDII